MRAWHGLAPAPPAYNYAMHTTRSPRLSNLLAWLPALLLTFGTGAALAQNAMPSATAPSAAATAPSRPERAVERLRIQDAGSRIDELRVGGETQSISVQPGGNAPAYEVRPADASRSPAGSAAQDGAGARFWNVLKF